MRNKFSHIDKASSISSSISPLDNKFMKDVYNIIEKYYTDPYFDVDHFASAMCVSRSQLYKKLKALSNLSANDFINIYRLKKSSDLLKHRNMQINEIAYAVGFNDPKYFSRLFKKLYHCTPSEYTHNNS